VLINILTLLLDLLWINVFDSILVYIAHNIIHFVNQLQHKMFVFGSEWGNVALPSYMDGAQTIEEERTPISLMLYRLLTRTM